MSCMKKIYDFFIGVKNGPVDNLLELNGVFDAGDQCGYHCGPTVSPRNPQLRAFHCRDASL